jgi:3-keto-disaccharide hydrolase
MRRLILCSIIFAAVGFTQSAPNTLTSKESADGWILLFDGKSLKGWQGRATTVPNTTGDWTVENGSIVCNGKVPSWLSSDAAYSDYELKLDFRGAEKVNSGVFLRSQKQGEPHVTGYELQIWDYQPAGFLTGSLVNYHKASPVKIVPNQWNTYNVTASGDHMVVTLNGKSVLDVRDKSHASGVVGLQCQVDNRIEFRNIKIRPRK